MTEYGKALMKNPTIRKLGQKVGHGTITAAEMNCLCGEYGKIAGRCIGDQLLAEYPNGQASEDDVRVIASPVLREMHKFISEITVEMINAQYEKAGIGIKAVVPEYNVQWEDELVKDLSQRSFEDELE